MASSAMAPHRDFHASLCSLTRALAAKIEPLVPNSRCGSCPALARPTTQQSRWSPQGPSEEKARLLELPERMGEPVGHIDTGCAGSQADLWRTKGEVREMQRGGSGENGGR